MVAICFLLTCSSSDDVIACSRYNVLKVARRSFLTSADPVKADFYERAILNGIVGNQNREASGATSYIYMQPLGGANTKPWGKSDFGFPCCWGTLSESFAKLGDSIFFWQPATMKAAKGTAVDGEGGPITFENVDGVRLYHGGELEQVKCSLPIALEAAWFW